MVDFDKDIKDIEKRMTGAIISLKNDFLTLRTGRASSTMLDPVSVEVYGSRMPLSQCSTITVPDPRMIQLNVWDKSNIGAVEKSIINSGLGLNPQTEGNLIRLILPELNEERRKELAKLAANYGENAKVAIRNVRKDGMDKIKKSKSEGMSEDEAQLWNEEIQKLTNLMINDIERLQKDKQAEIINF